jgi:hypothetical protein
MYNILNGLVVKCLLSLFDYSANVADMCPHSYFSKEPQLQHHGSLRQLRAAFSYLAHTHAYKLLYWIKLKY